MPQRDVTIRRAIVLAVLTGLLIPALLIGGISWFKKYDEEVIKRTEDVLQENVELLVKGMQEPLRNRNQESGSSLLNVMLRNPDVIRIEVRDKAHKIFVSGNRPEKRIGYSAATQLPIIQDHESIGYVELEVSGARLKKAMLDSLVQYLLALVAQIVLSVVLIMILLEKRLVGPLRRLGAGAERLAQGLLHVPFTWTHQDEIGLFSQRLETTRISLRNLFLALDTKNHEMEADITKRKQVEHELHEREERFRVLVEKSPIAIIEWDTSYHVIEWNTAAERIFGYSREQAMGQHAGFISVIDDRESLVEDCRKLIISGGEMKSVTGNRRADGKLIVCQWSNSYIPHQHGRPGRLVSIAEDITQKRQAEEAYRLSQVKFSSAFHGSPDYISISRIEDGVLLDINDAYEKFTGYTRKEAIGKSTLELNMWPFPEERAVLMEQLKATGVARDLPIRLKLKSGELRSCRINANTFNIEDVPHMMAVVRDVTDQSTLKEQKAEIDRALLRLAQGIQGTEGEAFFELLVTDIAAALRTDRAFIALRSPDTPDRIHTIAAYSEQHFVQNFEYDLPGSPCEHIMSNGLYVFAGGVKAMFPKDQALADEGWESFAGAPIRDAMGNAIGVLAVMHTAPLTNPDLVKSLLQVFSERASSELERKRAEEALRSSERRFAAMFHASPVSMALSRFGGDNAIIDVNQAFEKLFMRSRDQVVGKQALALSIYCDPNDRDSIISIIEQTGHIDRFETWMNLADGSKALIQLSGKLFEVNGEKFIILTGEDVTEKHMIENEILELNANLEIRVAERTEELQQANQELETTLDTLNMAQEELVRTEKLAALGALVAGIAHELNTPIGNSLMVASTLIDRTRAFTDSFQHGLKRSMLDAYLADAAKAGDILVRNLHKAGDLVTSFKQVAVDQTSSQRRQFMLSEAIGEIVLTLSPTIRKTGIKVKQDVPDKITMDSYPGPLGQIVSNLVNNALLHAFDGRKSGIITISAQMAGGDWVELAVKDNGVGISPANINRIFDPFFTTKLGTGGTGLGLNITHTLVTSVLGGRIRVQSEVGSGTTFLLSLPLQAPQRELEDDAEKVKSLFG
ncbi:MAG: PAS domain S-box protein [Burkholderiales bacterium]|nr:PAS domain S-box protein [Burkholderiales bacterium]